MRFVLDVISWATLAFAIYYAYGTDGGETRAAILLMVALWLKQLEVISVALTDAEPKL